MNPRSLLKGPNGLRAGWRLLIYAALLAAFAFAAYRISTVLLRGHEPDFESPLVLAVYPSILCSITLLAGWIMGKIERRTIADYGFPWRRAFCKQFWQAAGISFVSLTVVLFALWLAGFYSFGPVQLHGAEIWTNAFLWAIAITIAAIYEEFLYRGYLQFTLTTGIGFWPAALVTSVFMAWVHHFNPGWTWLGLATVGGFGLIACLLLRRTGDLWMPLGLHAGWNYGEAYFFGVPSSGLMGRGQLLHGSFHGPAWATGMPFGVEAGWPNVLVFLIWWLLFAKWLRRVNYPKHEIMSRPVEAL
jgi:uncharacterized protein